MHVGIIGAGLAGLAAAHDLARAGCQVTVLDAMAKPGGLASGFGDERWDWPIEHYYHHLFTSDADIIGLARETGFGDRLITRRPVTASYYRGRAYALDGPLPVLRFPCIPLADRVRLGLAIAYLKTTRDWRALEHVTAADWIRRWMGPRAYDVIWEPLLAGKFGDRHAEVPMSWLWARLHKRSMRLIYFEGGFQAFADHLLTVVEGLGGTVRLETPVRSLRRDGDGLAVETSAGTLTFDRIICTTGPHLLARMAPDLPADYLAALQELPYLGAAVAVLALDRQLMTDGVYWLSLDKREFPFLACVEHTNFMDPRHYGGDHLVYVGDYVPPDHPYLSMDEDQLLDTWLPALRAFNPDFDRSWIRRTWLSRTSYAQPVVPLGFSEHIPPLETPLPGLYLASMSQVYPWDRGTNYAVQIGRRAAGLVAEGLPARDASGPSGA